MQNDPLQSIHSPFAALRRALNGIEPGKDPIDLTIGAPKHTPPPWVAAKLTEAIDTIGTYPAIQGTDALCRAILTWAENRYSPLKGRLTPEAYLPLNGSREGLFYAAFIAKARRPDIKHPLILLPNPYYQVYSAAAEAAGSTPQFLNTSSETGFLPNLEHLTPEILERTIAFYLCSPSNPEGAVASPAYLKAAIALARQYDFMLFSDECYSEIYDQTPPTSALEVAIESQSPLQNVCAFNSLSKRSNVPGLRSGFVLGDPKFMEDFRRFRNVAAPQIPGPVQHASAHLWADETHVRANRELYREKFQLAEDILGTAFSCQKPTAGFFLWLNFSKNGGGINAVTTLWKECGVKLLPGTFLARPDQHGQNPAADYARLALVSTPEQTKEALERIINCLG